jgi:hypothetical protein
MAKIKEVKKLKVKDIERLIGVFGSENIEIVLESNGAIVHKATNFLLKRVKELEAVIDRLGTIYSEEYGSGETEYEDELNHLFEKKTLYVQGVK